MQPKFSPEICRAICSKIADGERPMTAAESLGISRDVFRDWTMRMPEFKYAIMVATGRANGALECVAYQGAMSDSKEARGELSVRDPIQHSEKLVASLALESGAGDILPDIEEAKQRAKQARLAEWKQAAHLIDAGDKIIQLKAVEETPAKKEPKKAP